MDEEVDLEALDRLADELVADHRRFMTRLVQARERAGLSQQEVARRMGTSQSNISTFERYDSNPTLQTIRRYALAVGVKLRSDVLYHGPGPQQVAREDIRLTRSHD